jgi:hypothetical protein
MRDFSMKARCSNSRRFETILSSTDFTNFRHTTGVVSKRCQLGAFLSPISFLTPCRAPSSNFTKDSRAGNTLVSCSLLHSRTTSAIFWHRSEVWYRRHAESRGRCFIASRFRECASRFEGLHAIRRHFSKEPKWTGVIRCRRAIRVMPRSALGPFLLDRDCSPNHSLLAAACHARLHSIANCEPRCARCNR